MDNLDPVITILYVWFFINLIDWPSFTAAGTYCLLMDEL
jgi:hypothetical protein